MKSLSELREKVYPVPSIFAIDDDISDASDDESSIDEGVSYKDGFSDEFADRKNIGRYIERDCINELGSISSREIYFRESGGEHTYNGEVVADMQGYPEGAVLSAYDGDSLFKVESQVVSNNKSFIGQDGLADYSKIDVPIGDKVYWTSSVHKYGIEEGILHLNLDYTRAKIISYGEVIEEDSLVIGSRDFFIQGSMKQREFLTIINTPIGNLERSIACKGKAGDRRGEIQYPVARIDEEGDAYIELVSLPTIGKISGTANYFMSFFAKKGSSFSAKLVEASTDSPPDVIWTAIPILPIVKEDGDD